MHCSTRYVDDEGDATLRDQDNFLRRRSMVGGEKSSNMSLTGNTSPTSTASSPSLSASSSSSTLSSLGVHRPSNGIDHPLQKRMFMSKASNRRDSPETVDQSMSDRRRRRVRSRISVTDTGIGIKKSDFEKLFKIYSQCDGPETSRRFGGTGLGLAISKRLSELLGGVIDVTSTEGEGTRFDVCFEADAADENINPITERENRYKGRTCLLVEHLEQTQWVLKNMMEEQGFIVSCTNCPDVAAQMVHAAIKPFDVILLDITLPEKGYEVFLQKSDLPVVKGSSIIFLTEMVH